MITVDKAMWEPAGGWQREVAKRDKRIAKLEEELALLEGRSVIDILNYVDSLEQMALGYIQSLRELEAENQRLRGGE